jgi:beta-lactamase regulating signal transducer with metallopeptidase domain
MTAITESKNTHTLLPGLTNFSNFFHRHQSTSEHRDTDIRTLATISSLQQKKKKIPIKKDIGKEVMICGCIM